MICPYLSSNDIGMVASGSERNKEKKMYAIFFYSLPKILFDIFFVLLTSALASFINDDMGEVIFREFHI